ncbi:TOPRIM nucleotidyl transferase/hydrolase domain-containing protein, partial [Frankia sp. AiPa1]|uniref:TOPRIM nucleotidyl transferase/hydrolase domain-containing protein n=1 Tax=Frankia sp. AiPa1 TaxID=573492 RepID=UPI00202AF2D5
LQINDDSLFILDAMGKFNLHRFMNLFRHLGIYHSVLYDEDSDRKMASAVKGVLEGCRNPFTIHIHAFAPDLEGFLNIERTKPKHRKPQHALYRIRQGVVPPARLAELSEVIKRAIAS